jgi:hypothetical protein
MESVMNGVQTKLGALGLDARQLDRRVRVAWVRDRSGRGGLVFGTALLTRITRGRMAAPCALPSGGLAATATTGEDWAGGHDESARSPLHGGLGE